MFLYQSNRLQELFRQLCAIIATPLADPLQPEIIVVHNQGMARWLQQQIAQERGIAANLEFPLPARFVWDLFAGQLGELPAESVFDRDVMLWRIFALLPDLAAEMADSEPARYLAGDEDGRRRLQLAEKISDVFDQYLVFRPDLLTAWEQGQEGHWQAVLWRRLADCGEPHRGRLLQRFLRLCHQDALARETLPERVCLFGLSSLAPAYLEVIHRISRHTEVHLFHLNPCRHFWGDLASERELARLRRKWRLQGTADLSQTYDAGHPLLASLGAVGRDFFRQLVDLDLQDVELYAPSGQDTLLGRLQDDILDLVDRTADHPPHVLAPDDRSIQFHVCHGVLREVQVLHDRLLDLFTSLPGLLPRDILVMAPDMEQYGAAVRGVFGSAPEERRIPWAIADQPRQRQHPVAGSFLDLLALLEGRFTAPEVMAFLENPAVLRRFGLQEDDLPELRAAIAEAGIRWGLDREHRRGLGVEADGLHTWSFGLDRLLLGYVMGAEEGLYDEILPLPPRAPAILGGLGELLARLGQWRRQLERRMTADQWSEHLLALVEDFFAGDDEDQDLSALRESISDLAACCRRASWSGPLSLQVVRRFFRQVLARPGSGQAFLGGQVTFCNMVPMRSIPFRVIWLLGMNDTDFPRSQRPPAFDLMAQQPRIGDRNRRNDDRYLFLEALLSARDVFAVSWMGRSPRDNSLLPPSVVVGELRDHIDRAWTCAGPGRPTDRLTVEHPLQPFSRRCFDPAAATASYAASWMPAARQQKAPPFLTAPLPPDPGQAEVDLDELIRFWCHPVRSFLRQRLGLRLDIRDQELEESEPFSLDNLERYHLAGTCLDALLADPPRPCDYHALTAAGLLPHHGFGRGHYRQVRDLAATMADQIRSRRTPAMEPVEIALTLEGIRLGGWLRHLTGSGIVTWRPASCKGPDLLRLWLCHLVLHLAGPKQVPRVSSHVASDSVISLRPVADAAAELGRLLVLHQQGLCKPLHFYPRTSLAWARAREQRRMTEADRTWQGSRFPECEDIHYRIALRGADPLDAEFKALAGIFLTILAHAEKADAVS